jgi:hypothetical protein
MRQYAVDPSSPESPGEGKYGKQVERYRLGIVQALSRPE